MSGPISAFSGADFLQLDVADAPARGAATWIADAVRRAAIDGRVEAGVRLPPSRALAKDLGVSRGVVVEAYRRLLDQGVVVARTGAGTFIAEQWPRTPRTAKRPRDDSGRLPVPALHLHEDHTGTPIVDLSPGYPDVTCFPRAAWLRHERAVLAGATIADLGYGDPRGHPALRHELSSWLGRTRGVHAAPEDIVVVAGVAQSLALLMQVVHRSDVRSVAVEDPGSRGAREEVAYWGMTPVPVPVDDEGVRVDALATSGSEVVLLTPAHHFPTGVVLGPRRRRELLAWAEAGDRLIIEDDYDAEHRYDRGPVAALQPSAPERVAHTGSVSKTLAPAVRLGWLVPPRALLDDLVTAKHASDLGSPAVPQLVLARMIASGDLDRHLRAARVRQRRRRDALVAAVREHLPQARISGIEAGLHLMLTLPGERDGFDDALLAEQIRETGIVVHPLSMHRVVAGPPGLVLGYAAHPPDQLHEAVRRLAAVMRLRRPA